MTSSTDEAALSYSSAWFITAAEGWWAEQWDTSKWSGKESLMNQVGHIILVTKLTLTVDMNEASSHPCCMLPCCRSSEQTRKSQNLSVWYEVSSKMLPLLWFFSFNFLLNFQFKWRKTELSRLSDKSRTKLQKSQFLIFLVLFCFIANAKAIGNKFWQGNLRNKYMSQKIKVG